MTSRVLSSDEIDEFLSAHPAERFPGPGWNARATDAAVPSAGRPDPAAQDGDCLRGIAFAVGAEAAAALLLLGAWQLWHTVR